MLPAEASYGYYTAPGWPATALSYMELINYSFVAGAVGHRVGSSLIWGVLMGPLEAENKTIS